ncbi:MAG TPA: 4'-phosphopantetheinyl transferase superfamily protein [Rhodanobacteraceae bacterium]|jgi:4'-phosphopantetheinyl transferase|nr:4'-phosphopantetheinyl transferase superfamily protein [Rhodanobacteraceae bacterium]
MSLHLEFVRTNPIEVAPSLDDHSIHLWRIPYAPSQKRAPLVALLAGYLGVSTSSVTLDEDARGKPYLAHSAGARGDGAPLEFNWSHSGDYALAALSRRGEVGVDIERLGKNLRAIEIARRFFDGGEADALSALDPEARDQAFIGLWCAKEAVLKAVGEGLSFGLARLAFAHVSGPDWELARTDPALGEAGDWRVSGFDPAPGYRGSLAWRGGNRRIFAFQPFADRPG